MWTSLRDGDAEQEGLGAILYERRDAVQVSTAASTEKGELSRGSDADVEVSWSIETSRHAYRPGRQGEGGYKPLSSRAQPSESCSFPSAGGATGDEAHGDAAAAARRATGGAAEDATTSGRSMGDGRSRERCGMGQMTEERMGLEKGTRLMVCCVRLGSVRLNWVGQGGLGWAGLYDTILWVRWPRGVVQGV